MRGLLFCALMAPVSVAACPDAPDISEPLSDLIDEARNAPDQMAGQRASDRMWQLWLQAPDAVAQTALDEGVQRRSSFDYVGALESFTRLIKYCPDYAEGYNQRAFIHYLTEDFEAALVDVDQALTLSPDHVGAQSGRALILMNLGQTDAARQQLLAALENNPWLSERFLLSDGAPLGPIGEEL